MLTLSSTGITLLIKTLLESIYNISGSTELLEAVIIKSSGASVNKYPEMTNFSFLEHLKLDISLLLMFLPFTSK